MVVERWRETVRRKGREKREEETDGAPAFGGVDMKFHKWGWQEYSGAGVGKVWGIGSTQDGNTDVERQYISLPRVEAV